MSTSLNNRPEGEDTVNAAPLEASGTTLHSPVSEFRWSTCATTTWRSYGFELPLGVFGGAVYAASNCGTSKRNCAVAVAWNDGPAPGVPTQVRFSTVRSSRAGGMPAVPPTCPGANGLPTS